MEARLRSKTAAGTEGSPDALRGEYLRGAGLVSQTRRRIDGVAEAVAINLDDFSGLHAHLHLHRRTAMPGRMGLSRNRFWMLMQAASASPSCGKPTNSPSPNSLTTRHCAARKSGSVPRPAA